jgi:hypothetical protein
VLVTEGDPEVITSPGDWPLMTIEVRGIPVTLPDVLIRWPQ